GVVFLYYITFLFFFFFSSRRRHTRFSRDWSSDVCSSDLFVLVALAWKVQQALRISRLRARRPYIGAATLRGWGRPVDARAEPQRSEERRVGKECRSRWVEYH